MISRFSNPMIDYENLADSQHYIFLDLIDVLMLTNHKLNIKFFKGRKFLTVTINLFKEMEWYATGNLTGSKRNVSLL